MGELQCDIELRRDLSNAGLTPAGDVEGVTWNSRLLRCGSAKATLGMIARLLQEEREADVALRTYNAATFTLQDAIDQMIEMVHHDDERECSASPWDNQSDVYEHLSGQLTDGFSMPAATELLLAGRDSDQFAFVAEVERECEGVNPNASEYRIYGRDGSWLSIDFKPRW